MNSAGGTEGKRGTIRDAHPKEPWPFFPLLHSHYPPHGGERDEETPGWEGDGGAVEVFSLSKTLVSKTVLPFLGRSLKEIIQRKGKKNL